MRHWKKLRGLFVERTNPRWLAVIGCVMALVAVILILVWPRPVRYELKTARGDIDFSTPDIQAHTAEDGIAVIRPSKEKYAAESSESLISATDLELAPPDPWAGDTGSTYGGFTLPVSMDLEDSIGVLSIPDLGLSVRVYESDDAMEAMNHGVAHFKHTSNGVGNIGLSAHNINFDGSAGYFRDLYLLQKGAVISYETAEGTRNYAVSSIAEIDETDWSYLSRTEDNRLTMITCISGKPSKRLCVQAVESQG